MRAGPGGRSWPGRADALSWRGRLLHRYGPFGLVAVCAVPDPHLSDQVMAAVELTGGASFDPGGFAAFLAAQPDPGTKWAPRFVRITGSIPRTVTSKVLKRQLRAEGLATTGPVFARPGRELRYEPLARRPG